MTEIPLLTMTNPQRLPAIAEIHVLWITAGLGCDGRRNMRDLRRHPRHGRQPNRMHGPTGLSGLAMEVENGNPDCLRARLPGSARQLHGNAALSAASSGRLSSNDSPRRNVAT